MADADEDAIPSFSSSHHKTPLEDEDDGADSDDGAVDYRFLPTLSSKTGHKLPQRGEKDFEPNPTAKQASALDASRQAMHEVLGVVRVHAARTGMVGQFVPNPEDWDGQSCSRASQDNKRRSGALKEGEGRCVVVERFTGTYSKVMGQTDRRNWTWLLPEEALFLLERGSLELRWPDAEGYIAESDQDLSTAGHERSDDIETTQDETIATALQTSASDIPQPIFQLGSLPMSLQGAYATFIGKSGLTLEKYIIYANLKRAGYIVQRAPTWGGDIGLTSRSESDSMVATIKGSSIDKYTSNRLPATDSNSGIIYRMLSWLFTPRRKTSCPSLGPLISTGLFRDYSEIFRELALIPYHRTISSLPAPRRESNSPFYISFHVWKPSVTGTYRKTAPPPPSFQIAVLDACSTFIPTLEQIGDLLDTMPLDELPTQKRLENRIKHGKRNVILAIVDSGLTSYLRISEAAFGEYKLYEEKARNAVGKKGGWRGRRGRGGGGKGGRGGSKQA